MIFIVCFDKIVFDFYAFVDSDLEWVIFGWELYLKIEFTYGH